MTLPQQKCFVKLRGYAVKFHRNAQGDSYSQVPDKEATIFDSAKEALEACKSRSLDLRKVVIEPVEETKK